MYLSCIDVKKLNTVIINSIYDIIKYVTFCNKNIFNKLIFKYALFVCVCVCVCVCVKIVDPLICC